VGLRDTETQRTREKERGKGRSRRDAESGRKGFDKYRGVTKMSGWHGPIPGGDRVPVMGGGCSPGHFSPTALPAYGITVSRWCGPHPAACGRHPLSPSEERGASSLRTCSLLPQQRAPPMQCRCPPSFFLPSLSVSLCLLFRPLLLSLVLCVSASLRRPSSPRITPRRSAPRPPRPVLSSPRCACRSRRCRRCGGRSPAPHRPRARSSAPPRPDRARGAAAAPR